MKAKKLSDFPENKKVPQNCGTLFDLSAGCWLQLSNLKSLSELADSRLKKPVSPHKISSEANVTISDNLTRDLIAINEFMNTIEL